MSLRWRSESCVLVCGSKSEEMEGDTYVDDRLHYQLAVILKVVVPDEREIMNGLWYWKEEQ